MRTVRTVLGLVVLSLIATSCNANRQPTLSGAAQDLVNAGVPGVVVMVSTPEETRVAVAGDADAEGNVTLTADHLFPIGGLTTSYVAAAMLQLDHDGEISLGDAVEDYLPGRFSYGWDIALYDLLQHTSGIPDYTDVGDAPGVVVNSCLTSRLCDWTGAELTALVQNDTPDFGPGEGWGYSNTNYVVAGEIMEQETGASWQSIIDDRFLQPLGLTQTQFTSQAGSPRVSGPVAVGYVDLSGDGVLEAIATPVPGGSGPEGGIMASAGDVMGFFRPLFEGQLLDPASQIALTATAPTSFGHEDYGLGVSFIFGFDKPQMGTTGEALGYSAFVEHNRTTDVTTVILVNQSGDLPAKEWGALLSVATDLPGRAVQARAADSGPGQLRLYCTLDPSLFGDQQG